MTEVDPLLLHSSEVSVSDNNNKPDSANGASKMNSSKGFCNISEMKLSSLPLHGVELRAYIGSIVIAGNIVNSSCPSTSDASIGVLLSCGPDVYAASLINKYNAVVDRNVPQDDTTVTAAKKSDWVCQVRILNEDSGFGSTRTFRASCLKRPLEIFGSPFGGGIRSIQAGMLRTISALGVNYARKTLVNLLRVWPREHRKSTFLCGAKKSMEKFVTVCKFLIAAEGLNGKQNIKKKKKSSNGDRKIAMDENSSESDENVSAENVVHGDNDSIVSSLRTVLREMLEDEVIYTDIEHNRDDDINSHESDKQKSDEIDDIHTNSSSSSTAEYADVVESSDEDESEALSFALSLSMNPTMKAKAPNVQMKHLENEKSPTAKSRVGTLGSELVRQCTSHLLQSTSQETKSIKTYESLHPFVSTCNYLFAVSFSAAKAVRVTFDRRCETAKGCVLKFWADKGKSNLIASMQGSSIDSQRDSASSSEWRAFIIHQEKFWVSFSSNKPNNSEHGWGYKFVVSPIHVQLEVVEESCLEWACWVLEFLLSEGDDKIRRAIHTPAVVEALLRYLRTSGAPYKNRVVALLTQLLKRPNLFPGDGIGFPISCISVVQQIGNSRRDSRNRKQSCELLPSRLQSLLELSVTARKFMCSRLSNASKSFLKTESKHIKESKEVPPPSESQKLYEAVSVMNGLLCQSTPHKTKKTKNFQESFVYAAALEMRGGGFMQSVHPHSSGKIGGDSMEIDFDLRSRITPDATLILQSFKCEIIDPSKKSAMSNPKNPKNPNKTLELSNHSFIRTDKLIIEETMKMKGEVLIVTIDGGDKNTDSLWGFAANIRAAKLNKFMRQLMKVSSNPSNTRPRDSLINSINSLPKNWTFEDDAELVRMHNNIVEQQSACQGKRFPQDHYRHMSLHQLSQISIKDKMKFQRLANKNTQDIATRFSIILNFNKLLSNVVHLIDLTKVECEWSFGFLLRSLAYLVFADVKSSLLVSGLKSTTSSVSVSLRLDRQKAIKSKEDGVTEATLSNCLFTQAFRQLHKRPPSQLRHHEHVFSVKFAGERAVDAGGPYREAITQMVEDLFSNDLNLLILCPNGVQKIGQNQDAYVPNAAAASPKHIRMFEFIGKLLGISLRTKASLPFCFPPVIWKAILDEDIETRDLSGIDEVFVTFLKASKEYREDDEDLIPADLVSEIESDFKDDFGDLRFVVTLANGSESQLYDGGRDVQVSWQQRQRYLELAEKTRMKEFVCRLLRLFTSRELEELCCGREEVSVSILQQHTEYRGYKHNDPTIKFFWQVMNDWDDEERSRFIRFAWGRNRLPRGTWSHHLTITRMEGSLSSLPISHTCFFTLELPAYTSLSMMRSRLSTTIKFGLGGMLLY
eukprot:GSMAST32.ASY1.ANO1.127.1 assembled CDS